MGKGSTGKLVESAAAAVESLGGGRATGDEVWISALAACTNPDLNQLVVFLKPETTAISDGVRFAAVFEALLETLFAREVGIGAVRVVSGSFFERTGIMQRHYGVINAISRLGEAALSESARHELRERFGEELSRGYEVIGGHQFLRDYPLFSPFALSVLFDSLGSTRLAPGTYACALSVEGRRLLLLNGFHPYQLERFTRADAVTVLLEGLTSLSWKSLRQEVAGATDPAKAAAGSFRRTLLERRDEFGLKEVSQNANGIHMSAGPLEGMVEVQRFFQTEATCFGRLLTETGLSTDAIARLAENPTLQVDGRSVSAFDLTEDMDSRSAALALQGR